MLSVKENLLETMKKDGNPDRFVKQFEFLHIIPPISYYMGDYPFIPGTEGYDQYGVLWRLALGHMGPQPVHDDEHIVLKDITKWREILHKPVVPPDPGYIGMLKGIAAQADRENQYVCALHPQGLFERVHALMSMVEALAAYYEEPEEMHALIDFLTEVELDFAKFAVEVIGVEAVLHHDDWGSLHTTMMSPEMFAEFFVPAYKKIYGYYKDHNVLVVHHNDAYSATLVPYMIEMGIDIWQGPTPTNNIPELIEKYGGQITFMGEIETKVIDLPDWTQEAVAKEVERACRKCGKHSFIPSLTAGMNISGFPGVYDAVNAEIDRMSREMF